MAGEDHERRRHHDADAGAQNQARPVGGVEEAVPEGVGFQPSARGQHEGDDAVDDDQREVGGDEVEPADQQVGALGDLVPGGVVDQRGDDLDDEEDPLDGPAPDVGVDQGRDGPGEISPATTQIPTPEMAPKTVDTRISISDDRLASSRSSGSSALHRQGLGDRDEQAAADGEVGDDHVGDRHDGHEHAAAHAPGPRSDSP